MIDLKNKLSMDRNFMEYRFDMDDCIDIFCEGMIKNNEIKGLLPISFQQIDNEKYYSFDVSGLISLSSLLHNPISKNQLINIFINIIDILENVNEYMIEKKYLLLQVDKIYVDQERNVVNLICLPIENIENVTDLSGFIKHILIMAKYQNNEDTSYVTKILNFINSRPECSLSDIKSLLLSIKNEQITLHRNIPNQNINEEKPKSKSIPIFQDISKKETVTALAKEEIIEISQSKRNDGIPTLKRKKKKNNGIKDKQKKEKKSSFLSFRKNTPKKDNKKSSIPTLTKRKEAKVNNEISRNIELTYAKDIQSGNFTGTTILGQNDGTTVLSGGTTVLSVDQVNSIKYATITRVVNGKKIEIKKAVFNIGTDINYNDFIISNNTAVSRKHAEIHYENGKYYILDLNSTNKTIVDGTIVRPGYKFELFSGSRIKLADEDFIFEM